MTLIQHENMLDVSNLAELARQCEDFLTEVEDDPSESWDVDDIGDARDTLTALRSMLMDLGIYVALDGTVSGELDDIARNYEQALIAEDHFPAYAEELASDIGAIDSNASWPLTFIDWDAAADALKVDYSAVTLDGHEYLIRSW